MANRGVQSKSKETDSVLMVVVVAVQPVRAEFWHCRAADIPATAAMADNKKANK